MQHITARVASIQARFEPAAATPLSPAPTGQPHAFQQMLTAQLTGQSIGSNTLGAFVANTGIANPLGAFASQPMPTSYEQHPVGAASYAPAFQAAGDRYGVDPSLLAAVAWTESNFDPNAISPAGAIGLMQIMPGTAAGLGVDPHDPIQAIDGAARYLREQLDRFGSVELALAAYNAGPGAVQEHNGIPPYAETTHYVSKVIDRYHQLRTTT